MQEGQRVRDIHEPGHRYLPRGVRPRLVRDVVAPRRSAEPTVSPHQTRTQVSERPLVNPLQDFVKPFPSQSTHQSTHKSSHQKSLSEITPQQQISLVKARPALPRQNRSLVLRRKIHDSAKKHKKTQRAERRRTYLAFAFGGLAASAMLGALFLVVRPNADKNSADKVAQSQLAPPATLGASTNGSRQTDETPVTKQQINAYKTNGSNPRVLRIPKLGVEARIVPVATGLNGEPTVTANIYDIGWLDASPQPGAKGIAIINGAKVGPTKAGILNNVEQLQVGDEIQVEQGNGKTLKFEVVGSKTFENGEVNMNAVRSPGIAGANGLNIVTNTGRFNVKINRYEPRTLIMTVLR